MSYNLSSLCIQVLGTHSRHIYSEIQNEKWSLEKLEEQRTTHHFQACCQSVQKLEGKLHCQCWYGVPRESIHIDSFHVCTSWRCGTQCSREGIGFGVRARGWFANGTNSTHNSKPKKNLINKWAEDLNRHFFKEHTDGQQAREKMLHITNY